MMLFRWITAASPVVKDRISELPDDILSHIIMPLSLRHVVRLGILARRWNNIWLELPHIHLDWLPMLDVSKCIDNKVGCESIEETKAECDLFVNNVDQVLQRHNSRYVLSFRISCCLDLKYAKDVCRWLNFAANMKGLESLSLEFRHKVKHGILELNVEGLLTISGDFLSQFTMLKKLYLYGCVLQVESDFRFDKLERLELNYVSLEGIQWGSFLCVPTIKSIRLRHCNLPDKLCLANNLEHLNLLAISGCRTLRRVEINASNLKTFVYFGDWNLECCFLARSKLEDLYLYSCYKKRYEILHMLRGFGDDISALKHLIIRAEIFQLKLPTWPAGLFRSVLWLQLDLSIGFCHERDTDRDFPHFLPHLLRCFPMMRKLDLTIPHYVWPYYHLEEFELPTSYLHTNLMEIELHNFEVSWAYLGNFLLRSAIVLERRVITRSFTVVLHWGCLCEFPLSYSILERLRIQNALLGKALSPRANVIIR